MSVDQIVIAVSVALTVNPDPDKESWPPSLPDFIKLGNDKIDYHGAYLRCLSGKPEGRIEQWVYENAAFNIKSSGMDAGERLHRKFMLQAQQKQSRGELQLNDEMLKALPVNSTVSVTDRKLAEFNETVGRIPYDEMKKRLFGG